MFSFSCRRAQEQVCGNIQPVVKFSDHGKGKTSLVVEHLADFGPWADVRLKVLPRESHLIHSEFDSFDRIGRANGIVSVFLVTDEHSQKLKPVGFRCAGLGVRLHECFHFLNGRIVFFLCFE